ncbi:MAG: alkaline phosphatase family protein [Gemmatimonadaceae bacterium]
MNRRTLLPVLAVLAGVGSGCSRPRAELEPGVVLQGAPAATRGHVTDHVVVISVDGLRPDAIAKFDATTLRRLMREGRHSLTAQTISNSKTLPSHTSMLTGVEEDVHGITWNSDRTGEFGYVKVPTVFGLATDAGFTTAAFFSKPKFHHVAPPGTVHHVRGPAGGVIPWNSGKTIDMLADYLSEATPNLLFVHLADADFAGHNFGWMGWWYGMAVRESDNAVARVLALADKAFGRGGYTVIVTSDHGGHGKSHGTTDPLDMTIPWIVWGAGVRPGGELSGIRTMDTAATALWLLNIATPRDWVGRVITAAFEPTVAAGR